MVRSLVVVMIFAVPILYMVAKIFDKVTAALDTLPF